MKIRIIILTLILLNVACKATSTNKKYACISTRIAYTFSEKVQAYFFDMKKENYVKYDKINTVTFIERLSGIENKGMGRFKCECGNEFVSRIGSVKIGRKKYCNYECPARKERVLHINIKHGYYKTDEYHAWQDMKKRCLNVDNKNYHNYGGRGIMVCDEWIDSFETFFKDMGVKPSKLHSLDRIKVNGNYEHSNCRWATKYIQSINRRDSIHLTFRGLTKPLMEWSKILNISHNSIRTRLYAGWSHYDALSKPIRKRYKC